MQARSARPEAPSPGAPAASLVGIHCPRCQSPQDEGLIARLVDGPGVQFRVVLSDQRQPGDFEVRCPNDTCRTFYYLRSWRAA